jgi:hypothetical protein
MDQFADFVETKFLGAFAKDKQHGVNDVGLSRSIGPDDSTKALVKGTNLFDTSITFKVLEFLL